MAGNGSHDLGFRLDVNQINQILSEAQQRWLRPAEICEILQNYQKFHISPEPPNRPVSGSVFLFDRKVLRYFRKDGHNWRKKKDGKTVKEAHEKLKVGSVDMLHCYYAHGEENENFQRRSYWLLDPDLMHIVFVHYLEVKGNKTNINSLLDAETVSSNSQNDSSLSFSSSRNDDKLASAYTDATSPTSTLTSTYEDAECVDNHQGSSRLRSYPETSQAKGIHLAESPDASTSSSCRQTIPSMESMLPHGHEDRGGHEGHLVSGVQRTLDLASWEEVLGHCTAGDVAGDQASWNLPEQQANWQYSLEDSSLRWQGLSDQNLISSSASTSRGNFLDQKCDPTELQKFPDPFYMSPGQEEEPVIGDYQKLHANAQLEHVMNDKAENSVDFLGTGSSPLVLKHSHLSGVQREDGLKKVDSFSRWMAKELGEVDGLHLQSNNGYSWSEIQAEDVVVDSCLPTQLQLDADTLNFSLSQDQLFSITDFSPSWAYSNSKTKVLITGRFLKDEQEFVRCKWSCMFGQVEVPAEVLADGVLCCHAPTHKAGLVPFYVTCSNRVACSEVRDFEYRPGPLDIDFADIHRDDMSEIHMYERFEKLLLTDPVGSASSFSEYVAEKRDMVEKIISLMESDDTQMTKLSSGRDVSLLKSVEEQEVEKRLKEKFYMWLIQKVTVDGRGPSIVDDEGQGVLHLAAALGFNWALWPIIVSGVSIDFRDVNGWTALHWAAFYGREDTVVTLVSLGASSGALTDPSAEYPLGRTPADLASANGHKGISGFLAECSLTSHLSSLTVNESEKDDTLESGVKAIQTVSERVAAPVSKEDVPDSLSLKDSLAAVCNATQAAARIHQIFRVQSFQRKQLIERGSDEPSSSDERALSVLAAKARRLRQSDRNAAAISIQTKFRGWKKRKEFLIIRQRIVKIQAHVRGHQARKKYKPIIWSVGILEKVILRWRRKGSGLRGFRTDAITKDPSTQDVPVQDDDYDLLKEGRKHTEERLQKALARVKSMAQYPEARAQYRRLLTVAEGFRDTKDATGMVSEGYEVNYPDADLLDVDDLLDDDPFMSLAFE